MINYQFLYVNFSSCVTIARRALFKFGETINLTEDLKQLCYTEATERTKHKAVSDLRHNLIAIDKT